MKVICVKTKLKERVVIMAIIRIFLVFSVYEFQLDSMIR